MSQTATLYRVSQDTFEKLKASSTSRRFDIAAAKNYTTFQGSFMGLEYLLSKGQDQQKTELVSEIFNPKDALGRQEFENLSTEEQFEFYESGSFIPYLDTAKVRRINDLLSQVTEADFQASFDTKELNENGIYPKVWHNDDSPTKVFNLRHITEDLAELKSIFQQASTDKDNLLVFVG